MVVRARAMVPAAADGQAGVTGNGASGPRSVHSTFSTAEVLATAKAFVSVLALTPLKIQCASGSPLRALAVAPRS